MGFLSSIISWFSGGSSFLSLLPLAGSLVFGGLWLFERSENQNLAAFNGQLAAANNGQALAITELRAERLLGERILYAREVEIENIRRESAGEQAAIKQLGQTDAELGAWLAAPLPGAVRGLFRPAGDNAGANRQIDSAGAAAARAAGTRP